MFDGEAFGQQIVEIVRGYVSAELAPLVDRNAQLEAQIAQLEAEAREQRVRLESLEAADSYKGVWQRALPYRKGAQVTHKGALWVALINCVAGKQPDCEPENWQLAAKGKP